MNRLTSAILAVVIALVFALIAAFIKHLSALAALAVGAVTGVVAFFLGTLGATKTVLDIRHKRLEIRKTKHELQTLGNRIAVPSDEQIRKFGGVVYRQVVRKAGLSITAQEHLEARSFIADLFIADPNEEKTGSAPGG